MSEFGCAAGSTTAVTRVPRPGAVSIFIFPPMADTRSVIFVSPVPTVAGSNPRPVSLIVMVSVCASARAVIVTAVSGPPCLMAFCSASLQQK